MKIIFAQTTELAQNLPTMTFKQLSDMLPHIREKVVPRGDSLRSGNVQAVPLFKTVHKGYSLTVYQPGFFLYMEPKEETACAVWRCPHEIFNYVTDLHIAGQDDILHYPWHVALEAAGKERVLHNQDSREDSHIDFHYAPGTMDWSTMPHDMNLPDDILVDNEARRLYHAIVSNAGKELTPVQRKILHLLYEKEEKQVEIAKRLGVTPSAVSQAHRKALVILKAVILSSSTD